MRIFAGFALLFCLAGCSLSASVVGIVSPDSITSRVLRVRNESSQYIVVRVTAPDAAPLVTPVLCPGGENYCEMQTQFGTLCPPTLKMEIVAYKRAHPEVSPLIDETPAKEPFASVVSDLTGIRDFGCEADATLVSLNTAVDLTILQADQEAKTIGFRVGFVPPQQQGGMQVADLPAATPPEAFPLRGEVVDQSGAAMPNVEIRLPQLGASVYTDAQGQFSVMRPVGQYLLDPVLPGIEISPALQSFSHTSPDEVPIEFIALTGLTTSAGSGGE